MRQNSVTAQHTNTDEVLELQEDLNRLVDWENKWQMNFNVDNCAVMYIGNNNIQRNYTMANQHLIETEEQRDLGITVTKDLMWVKQTEKSNKTANRVLVSLPVTSTTKAQSSCSHSISPLSDLSWNMKSSSGHHIYMRHVNGSRTYQQRLKDLELTSLVQRRLWGQLIEVFKYLNRFNNVSPRGSFDYDLNDRARNNGNK